MEANKKVKRVINLQGAGIQIAIILGRADAEHAVKRVSASLERHGWLKGCDPRALVRIGGAA